MKKKWKIILGSLIGVIIILSFFLQYSKGIESTLLEVQPQTIVRSFSEEGRIVPKIEQPIYAPYNNQIMQLAVSEGQEVKKGDLLAVLDTEELNIQLRQLQSELVSLQGEMTRSYQEPYETEKRTQELIIEQTQLELNTAEDNYRRIVELYDTGAVAKKELEEARKTLEIARINLEQQKEALALLEKSYGPTSGADQFYAGRIGALEAQIEQVEYQINKGRIIAPIEGIVANLDIKEGEKAAVASPIMKIFQKNGYVLEVFVLFEDAQTLKKGMEVELSQDRKDEDVFFKGKIAKISPSIVEKVSALGLEEERVKITIDFTPPNELNLLPGSKLDAEFITAKQDNVLAVPKTAIFPYDNSHALWTVENGKAGIQKITKGFENERYVVIEDGLEKGDLVILNPQLEGLSEGKRINAKN